MYSERFKANCSSFAYIFNSKGVQRCFLKGLKQIVQVLLKYLIHRPGYTEMYSERFKANCSSFAYIFNSKGVQRCILKGFKQIVQVLLTYLIQRVYRDVF